MKKIVYQDGETIRALKGDISKEDDFFVFVNHSSGEIRLNKKFIIKIEEANND